MSEEMCGCPRRPELPKADRHVPARTFGRGFESLRREVGGRVGVAGWRQITAVDEHGRLAEGARSLLTLTRELRPERARDRDGMAAPAAPVGRGHEALR